MWVCLIKLKHSLNFLFYNDVYFVQNYFPHIHFYLACIVASEKLIGLFLVNLSVFVEILDGTGTNIDLILIEVITKIIVLAAAVVCSRY